MTYKYLIPIAPVTKKNSQQIYINRKTNKPFVSSQAVLLGKKDITYEALYISRNLKRNQKRAATQMLIFEELAV